MEREWEKKRGDDRKRNERKMIDKREGKTHSHTHTHLLHMATISPISPSISPHIKCLICGSPTRTTHQGIEACRACSVFYRRAQVKEIPFVCRTGTGRCKVGKGDAQSCKKCRFDLFEKILNGAKAERIGTARTALCESIPSPSPPSAFRVYSSQSPSTSFRPVIAESTPITSHLTNMREHSKFIHIRDPNAFFHLEVLPENGIPLIQQLKYSYRRYCALRRSCEMATRDPDSGYVHPTQIDPENIPLYPANYTTMNISCHIFIAALMEFGNQSFGAFKELELVHKWDLIRNCLMIFHLFEATYREVYVCKYGHDLCSAGYTSYFNLNMKANEMMKGAPSLAMAQEGSKYLIDMMRENCRICRPVMRRSKVSEEELVAALGLILWNVGGCALPDNLLRLAEEQRANILHDLHTFYKKSVIGDEYAGKIGSLFFLIMTCQGRCAMMPEVFQLCKLVDVFNDDTLAVSFMKH